MKYLRHLPSILAGGALAVLVLITIAAVVARYVFAAPFFWLEEVSGLLMIWIVMLGAIVAERDGQHLSVPLLTEALPRRLRAGLETVVSLASIGLLGYTAYVGWTLSETALRQGKITSILQFSWFWIDVAVPLGVLGVLYYMVKGMLRHLAVATGSTHESTRDDDAPVSKSLGDKS